MTCFLTLDEIKPLIDIPKLIGDIEDGFKLYSQGKVTVPPVGFLHFEEPPGDIHIKYGYVKGDDYYVLKMASGFYDNPQLGLPASDGLILVFSQKTGELKAILEDKCWLTDIRTAVAGAVAAKHLAPKKIKAIGIVGTGVQARLQLEMLSHVCDCKEAIIWGRTPDNIEKMISDIKGFNLKAATSIEELASDCQLIVTTTPAKMPLLTKDMVKPGTHITAIGSDDMDKQELTTELVARADILVADSISQCVHHGECGFPIRSNLIKEDKILELGTLIDNPEKGRTNDRQITIADLTGVAIQDIKIAKMVYQEYLKKEEK